MITTTQLRTLKYSADGSPFCQITATSNLNVNTTKYSLDGAPWYGTILEALTGTIKKVGTISWNSIKKIAGVSKSTIGKVGGVLAPQALSDVTPDAVDFGGVIESATNPVLSNQVTFTGINTAITVSITLVVNDGYEAFYYIKNSTEVEVNSFPVDITISNNDTLQLSAFLLQGYGMVLDIINVSDNNATLDSVTLSRLGGS
jgi:hypothetical protein